MTFIQLSVIQIESQTKEDSSNDDIPGIRQKIE